VVLSGRARCGAKQSRQAANPRCVLVVRAAGSARSVGYILHDGIWGTELLRARGNDSCETRNHSITQIHAPGCHRNLCLSVRPHAFSRSSRFDWIVAFLVCL